MKCLKAVVIGSFLMGMSVSALAQNYSFECITNNLAADCSVGEAQLQLSVTDLGGSSAAFKFSNLGSAASSITDVYFDYEPPFDYALTKVSISDSGAGVVYDWEASPGHLPGAPQLSAGINADSNPPAQPNGVNPGEWVTLTVGYAGSFANLLTGIGSQDLRIGVHVQGFAGGGSESFVATPVPEPETYAMLLAGLALMGFVARRRRERS